ncbi:uncharacterized protein LOC114672209 isoform X2 [Macaca mulatta]
MLSWLASAGPAVGRGSQGSRAAPHPTSCRAPPCSPPTRCATRLARPPSPPLRLLSPSLGSLTSPCPLFSPHSPPRHPARSKMARAAPPVSGELQQGVDDLGDQGPQTRLEPWGWPQPREGWIRRTGQQDRSGWKSSIQSSSLDALELTCPELDSQDVVVAAVLGSSSWWPPGLGQDPRAMQGPLPPARTLSPSCQPLLLRERSRMLLGCSLKAPQPPRSSPSS